MINSLEGYQPIHLLLHTFVHPSFQFVICDLLQIKNKTKSKTTNSNKTKNQLKSKQQQQQQQQHLQICLAIAVHHSPSAAESTGPKALSFLLTMRAATPRANH